MPKVLPFLIKLRTPFRLKALGSALEQSVRFQHACLSRTELGGLRCCPRFPVAAASREGKVRGSLGERGIRRVALRPDCRPAERPTHHCCLSCSQTPSSVRAQSPYLLPTQLPLRSNWGCLQGGERSSVLAISRGIARKEGNLPQQKGSAFFR